MILVVSCTVLYQKRFVYCNSLDYMLNDPHLTRFSCYITLSTFPMLILVTSENLAQLFFG
jgi:NADH:ubiquinone oxidoreductase subunit 5 (subunit L)/multisubunit Na+/H+ antiporter MnhA subunit